MGYEHRRRIKTEEKAKVVTDVWGTEYMRKKDGLHQDALKKGMYSSYSLYRPSAIVVNKQTESHKGFIFYLHEVELVYNDVHHSQPTLLTLSCYLSGFSGVLLRPPEIDSPYPSLNTALLASQPYTRRSRISRLAPVLIKHSVPISSLRAIVPKDPYSAT